MEKLNAQQLREKLIELIDAAHSLINNNVPVEYDEYGDVDEDYGLLRELQAEVCNFRDVINSINESKMSRIATIEVAVPQEYAIYFVYGDASVFDFHQNEQDENACRELEKQICGKGFEFTLSDDDKPAHPCRFNGSIRDCVTLTCIKQAEYEF